MSLVEQMVKYENRTGSGRNLFGGHSAGHSNWLRANSAWISIARYIYIYFFYH